jgi:hypothetical protein
MEVSGQFLVSAALIPGNYPTEPIGQRSCRKDSLEAVEYRNIPYPAGNWGSSKLYSYIICFWLFMSKDGKGQDM